MKTYIFYNLTTGERTADPTTALRWWKRGDWVKTN